MRRIPPCAGFVARIIFSVIGESVSKICVLLILPLIALAADSEGKNFVFNFARNYNMDNSNTNLTVTIVNNNDKQVTGVIIYYSDPLSKMTETVQFNISASSYSKFPIPSANAWIYRGGAFQTGYDTRITVTASDNVKVLGTNVNSDGQGDTFIVIPKEFIMGTGAPFRYSMSAPAPYNLEGQYTIFTFIPIQLSGNITVYTNDGVYSKFTFYADFTRGALQWSYGWNSFVKGDPNVFAESDIPFAVLVTVTCASTAHATCDHASFMAQPITSNYFSASGALNDEHPTDLMSSQMFYYNPPSVDSPTFEAFSNITLNNTIVAFERIDVVAGSVNKYTYPERDYGYLASLRSENALLQVMRVGGVPQSLLGGVFMDLVPAYSQYMTDSQGFVTLYPNDSVFMTLNAIMYLLGEIDGKILTADLSYLVDMTIDGQRVYFARFIIPQAGFHKITAPQSAKYSFYVAGNPRPGNAYGYLGGFNRQTDPNLPPPSSTSSTSTVSTTTTTNTGTVTISTSTQPTPLPTSTISGMSSTTSARPTSTTITTTTMTTTTMTTTTMTTTASTITTTMTTTTMTTTTMTTTASTIATTTTTTASTITSPATENVITTQKSSMATSTSSTITSSSVASGATSGTSETVPTIATAASTRATTSGTGATTTTTNLATTGTNTRTTGTQTTSTTTPGYTAPTTVATLPATSSTKWSTAPTTWTVSRMTSTTTSYTGTTSTTTTTTPTPYTGPSTTTTVNTQTTPSQAPTTTTTTTTAAPPVSVTTTTTQTTITTTVILPTGPTSPQPPTTSTTTTTTIKTPSPRKDDKAAAGLSNTLVFAVVFALTVLRTHV